MALRQMRGIVQVRLLMKGSPTEIDAGTCNKAFLLTDRRYTDYTHSIAGEWLN